MVCGAWWWWWWWSGVCECRWWWCVVVCGVGRRRGRRLWWLSAWPIAVYVPSGSRRGGVPSVSRCIAIGQASECLRWWWWLSVVQWWSCVLWHRHWRMRWLSELPVVACMSTGSRRGGVLCLLVGVPSVSRCIQAVLVGMGQGRMVPLGRLLVGALCMSVFVVSVGCWCRLLVCQEGAGCSDEQHYWLHVVAVSSQGGLSSKTLLIGIRSDEICWCRSSLGDLVVVVVLVVGRRRVVGKTAAPDGR